MLLDVLKYKEDSNSSRVLAMFEGFTNQYDWGFHQVEITETEQFQIILQTEVFQPEGQVQDSVFAIDDLQLEPGPCAALTDCRFDSGVCGFHNSLVWLLTRSPARIMLKDWPRLWQLQLNMLRPCPVQTFFSA